LFAPAEVSAIDQRGAGAHRFSRGAGTDQVIYSGTGGYATFAQTKEAIENAGLHGVPMVDKPDFEEGHVDPNGYDAYSEIEWERLRELSGLRE
jgi:hypothetical protein